MPTDAAMPECAGAFEDRGGGNEEGIDNAGFGIEGGACRAARNRPMKLASYKDGSRDGQLVVVSRDLSTAHYASGIATRLQQVLDDWNFLSPQLEDLSVTLNQGRTRHAFPFDPAMCMSPLPRAYQWADGAGYLNHLAVVRRTRIDDLPENLRHEPLLYQGGSDDFIGPCDDIVASSEKMGIDFEGEIAVITGDVPMGASPEQALDGIRLLMLANDVSLRRVIPAELERGFGFLQGKPATAFSPVAVTPDELGAAWHGGRVHLALQSTWNGKRVGLCDAGPEMTFHFGQLIAHLAKTRRVRAGSIVGGGTVSNADASRGYSCIAEKRALDAVQGGARTDFMRHGDTIRIEMKALDGSSLFGAIDQTVQVLDASDATATPDLAAVPGRRPRGQADSANLAHTAAHATDAAAEAASPATDDGAAPDTPA